MNKVFLTGRTTKEIELATTNNGTNVTRFTLAVGRKGSEETDFLTIVAWRTLAENCKKYVKKGDKIAVVGKIENRTYEVQGSKRYATEIVADEIEFLNSKKDNFQEQRERDLTPITDDDIPF